MADNRLPINIDLETKGIGTVIATFQRLAKSISAAFNSANKTADSTTASVNKTTAAIELQTQKVEELKAKLEGLKSGEIVPKSANLTALNKEFETTVSNIEKLEQKEDELKAKQADLAAVIPKSGSGAIAQTSDALEKVKAELKSVQTELERERKKSDEVAVALQEAHGAATQAEIQKTSSKLNFENAKLDEMKTKAKKAGESMQKEMSKLPPIIGNAGLSISNFGKRILGLAKRVFIFSLITRALRSVRSIMSGVLMSNTAFANSLAGLQSALWTAFAPIMSFVVPALTTLVSWIAAVINSILKLIATLTGKSFKAWQAQGKLLRQQVAAYNDSGKAADKAGKKGAKATEKETKALQKQLATFDEIQILQQDKEDSSGDVGGASGGGGGVGGGLGDIEGTPFEIDTAQFENLKQLLEPIAVLVATIGGALLAWKISENLPAALATIKGALTTIGGLALIAAGGFLLVKGYCDAWINGIDWNNFAEIMSGIALTVPGIAMVLSPAAAAFVLMGLGIATVILGIKDIIANGPTLQNILMTVSGAVLFILGLLTTMGKLDFWKQTVPLLMAIAGAFIFVKGATDAWVNGLDWENFSEILGGLSLVVIGIGLAFGGIAVPLALVGAGIAALVIGIKDLVTNGYSTQGVILVLVGAVAVLIGVIWALNAALLANPITWIIIAIMALVAAFVILWNKCEGFRNFWIGLWNIIKSSAIVVGTFLIKTFGGALDKIKEVWGKVGGWFSEKYEDIKNAIKNAPEYFHTLFTNAYNKVTGVFKAIGSWFGERWNDIKDAFSKTKEWFGTLFSEAWTKIKDTVKSWGDGFKDVWENIKKAFVGDDGTGVKEWFKTTFSDAWEKIKDVFSNWGDFFQGLWDTIKTKFTDLGKNLGNAIGNAVASGINSVITMIQNTVNRGIKLINGAIKLINKIPGVKINELSDITLPKLEVSPLATGAVIPANKPFLAMLGDQKQGTNIEAPLSTIEQAVRNVLAENGTIGGSGDLTVQCVFDDRIFGQIVVNAYEKEKSRTGQNFLSKNIVFG